MSSLRLGAKRATTSRLATLPLAKGLRMTLAMPPMEQLDDLDGKIPDCPSTIWNAEKIDLAAEQVKSRTEQLMVQTGAAIRFAACCTSFSSNSPGFIRRRRTVLRASLIHRTTSLLMLPPTQWVLLILRSTAMRSWLA